jgi:hypothetical protein
MLMHAKGTLICLTEIKYTTEFSLALASCLVGCKSQENTTNHLLGQQAYCICTRNGIIPKLRNDGSSTQKIWLQPYLSCCMESSLGALQTPHPCTFLLNFLVTLAPTVWAKWTVGLYLFPDLSPLSANFKKHKRSISTSNLERIALWC